MIRVAFVVAVLALVALGAAWFSDNPGLVAIDWGDWRIETSAGVAVAAAVLLAVTTALLYRLWRWLRTLPRRIRAAQEAERRKQGYRALTRGMVAVAAGDAEESHRLARTAEALLEEPPLTLLLSAQAAQLKGDERAAEKYFHLMVANPELEFLGLRGLLTAALRQGNAPQALEYARRAHRLSPRSAWIQGTLFELQLAANQWKQAEALLSDAAKRGSLPQAAVRRRRAILLLEQAADIESSGDRAAAVPLAERAHSAATDFVPAAVAAARLLAAVNKAKRGQKVLETTWRHTPHPDLAISVLALWPDEAPAKRLARTQALAATTPGHIEGAIAIVRAAIDARDYTLARRTLEAIGAQGNDAGPEARVCRLWAELEDAEHGPGLAAREWLLRASSATPDPMWVCGSCGQGQPSWRPACPYCGAFDSLEWRRGKAPAQAPVIEAPASVAAAALARPEIDIRRLAGPPAAVPKPALEAEIVTQLSKPRPEPEPERASERRTLPPFASLPPDVPLMSPKDPL